MMIILLGLLILFLILWIYNIKRRALLQFEFQNKLQALQEELRRHAIDHSLSLNSWVFTYLDTSIKNASANLKFFNYYAAWGLSMVYAKDKQLSGFMSKLSAEFDLPENRGLKNINYRFGNVIVEYVTKKHEFFSLVFLKVHTMQEYRNNRNRNKPQSQIINKIKNLRVYQDTSALKPFL